MFSIGRDAGRQKGHGTWQRSAAAARTAAGRCGWVVLLAAAGLHGAVAHAAAQPRGTEWTVSVVAGGLFAGDLAAGERELTYGGALGLGVGLGFSLEAEVAAVPNLRQFGDVRLLLGTGSLLFHPLTAGGVTPYGLLGASLARISTTRAGMAAERDVELAVDFGGGLWLRVSGPLALRADVRFIHIDNAPNFWRAATGLTLTL